MNQSQRKYLAKRIEEVRIAKRNEIDLMVRGRLKDEGLLGEPHDIMKNAILSGAVEPELSVESILDAIKDAGFSFKFTYRRGRANRSEARPYGEQFPVGVVLATGVLFPKLDAVFKDAYNREREVNEQGEALNKQVDRMAQEATDKAMLGESYEECASVLRSFDDLELKL